MKSMDQKGGIVLKNVLCAILALTCLLCMSGCMPINYLVESTVGREMVEEAENTVYFGFSSGTLFDDSHEVFLNKTDIDTYVPTTAAYRSSVMFDQLTAEEQSIYRAITYAMENGYTNILFEKQLAQNDQLLTTILNYVALDSPLLEQNLRYATGTFTTYIPITTWGPFTKKMPFVL